MARRCGRRRGLSAATTNSPVTRCWPRDAAIGRPPSASLSSWPSAECRTRGCVRSPRRSFRSNGTAAGSSPPPNSTVRFGRPGGDAHEYRVAPLHPRRGPRARLDARRRGALAAAGVRRERRHHRGNRQHPPVGRGHPRRARDALPHHRGGALSHRERQPPGDGGGQGRDAVGAHRLRACGPRADVRRHRAEGHRLMNDILTQAWLALSGVRPLDLWGAVRLADHLLAPLDLLLRALARAVDLPVIGAALVPAFVTFEFVTTLIAVVLVAGLLIGSALL